MWTALEASLEYAGLGIFVVLNLVGVGMVFLQLPGTWLIVAVTGLVAWWRWDHQTIGLGTMASLLALAVLGELIETGAASVGARQAGSTRLAMLAAMVGGVVGAIGGTMVIPWPVAGTIFGAVAGAGVGSIIADVLAGRTWKRALRGGTGAAKGKLMGTMGKIVIAALMWIVATIAVFWP